MTTARDRVEDRIKSFHDDADDYLIKPLSLIELLARRGRSLEPRAATAQLHNEEDGS